MLWPPLIATGEARLKIVPKPVLSSLTSNINIEALNHYFRNISMTIQYHLPPPTEKFALATGFTGQIQNNLFLAVKQKMWKQHLTKENGQVQKGGTMFSQLIFQDTTFCSHLKVQERSKPSPKMVLTFAWVLIRYSKLSACPTIIPAEIMTKS